MVLCSRKCMCIQHRHIRPNRKLALTSFSKSCIFPPNYICLVGYVRIISYFSYLVNRYFENFSYFFKVFFKLVYSEPYSGVKPDITELLYMRRYLPIKRFRNASRYASESICVTAE